ncbi:hypothetical protein BH20VER3_BH20VER3_22430 [soil metagenome]
MNVVRRYVEAALFVALWMGLGWIFRLDANSYLILGVPLLVAFQLGVRRLPLRTLWVREPASAFLLDGPGLLFAGLLMSVPALDVMQWTRAHGNWIIGLWLVCAVAGAVCAAFALRQQRPDAARRALPAFLAAAVIGAALMAAAAAARGNSVGLPLVKLWPLFHQFLSYFAVSFVLEEVVFRGALDSHVYPSTTNESESGARWWSAIFVSALWGIWHLPVILTKSALELVAVIPIVLTVHTLVGVPLSFAWRTGGTLVLPAFAHTLIDAYRNVIQ